MARRLSYMWCHFSMVAPRSSICSGETNNKNAWVFIGHWSLKQFYFEVWWICAQWWNQIYGNTPGTPLHQFPQPKNQRKIWISRNVTKHDMVCHNISDETVKIASKSLKTRIADPKYIANICRHEKITIFLKEQSSVQYKKLHEAAHDRLGSRWRAQVSFSTCIEY